MYPRMPSSFIGKLLGGALPAALLLCLTGPAHAAGPVLLRYHFSVGQRVSYVLTSGTSSVSAAGLSQLLNVKQRISYTEAVLKVYADGSANVRVDYGTGTLTIGGQTTDLPLRNMYVIERLSADGHVLATRTYGAPLNSPLAGIDVSSSGTPPLPSKPVALGASWTSNQSIALGSLGSVSVLEHLTLAAFGSWQGRQTAVIRSSGAEPFHVATGGITADGTASSSGDTTLLASNGMLVSVHGTVRTNGTLDTGNGSGPSPLSLVETIDIAQGR